MKIRKSIFITAASSLSFFALFIIIAWIQGITPFKPGGTFSLATEDAYYQYMDFFDWFKDVLSGKQSLSYTFSSYLGTNAVALYAYYLASPFCLLIGLFRKTQMQACYNIMVCLKLTLAAGTFSWYLQRRFEEKINAVFTLLLSLSYAMMQYSLIQSCNIMWLDALYMLPLMLLGVYRIIRYGNMWYFSIVTGICILCNWYMGGICCLVSFLWFLAEYFLQEERTSFIRCFARFIYGAVTGVLLSMVLFLPSVYVLRQGAGSSFNWAGLKDTHFLGSILNLVWGYSSGISTREFGFPGVYTGGVALAVCILYFTDPGVRVRKKIVNGLLLIAAALSMLWYPVYLIFSLMKNAQGFYCRYSFIWSLSLLFIAGQYFAGPLKSLRQKTAAKVKIIQGLLMAAVAVLLILAALYEDGIKAHENRELFYLALCFFGAASVLVLAIRNAASILGVRILSAALAACCILDLAVNENAVTGGRKWDCVSSYRDYAGQQTQLVDSIRDSDDGLYRIEQTQTRSMNFQSATANYNEGLGYNYMPVSGYTSCPPNDQIKMLEDLGYSNENEGRMLVKNTFLQPVDSLFGVKYLMSPYAVSGMSKVDTLPQRNGKDVYRNDCALPLAFSVDSAFQGSGQNSGREDRNYSDLNYFEKWNVIYRNLSGTDRDIMVPLQYETEHTDSSVQYTIHLPSGSYAVYGYIPSANGQYADGTLTFGNETTIPYGKWQAVRAFYCPSDSDSDTSDVSVLYQANNVSAVGEAQFYALDLDVFENVTKTIQDRAAEVTEFQNGKVHIRTEGTDGTFLFTSVPYDAGWKITRNGKEIRPVLFDNCLTMIPMEDGSNEIEMTYRVPGRSAGILLTLLGILLLLLPAVRRLHPLSH